MLSTCNTLLGPKAPILLTLEAFTKPGPWCTCCKLTKRVNLQECLFHMVHLLAIPIIEHCILIYSFTLGSTQTNNLLLPWAIPNVMGKNPKKTILKYFMFRGCSLVDINVPDIHLTPAIKIEIVKIVGSCHFSNKDCWKYYFN